LNNSSEEVTKCFETIRERYFKLIEDEFVKSLQKWHTGYNSITYQQFEIKDSQSMEKFPDLTIRGIEIEFSFVDEATLKKISSHL
jgi:hypothetical protein